MWKNLKKINCGKTQIVRKNNWLNMWKKKTKILTKLKNILIKLSMLFCVTSPSGCRMSAKLTFLVVDMKSICKNLPKVGYKHCLFFLGFFWVFLNLELIVGVHNLYLLHQQTDWTIRWWGKVIVVLGLEQGSLILPFTFFLRVLASLYLWKVIILSQ